MELNIFMRELESALVKRGIPDETAVKHVSNLRRTFTGDDLSEIEAIQSNEEIEHLADSISAILNRNRNAAAPQTQQAPRQPSSRPAPSQPVRDAVPVYEQPKPKQQPMNRNDEYFEYSTESNPTMKGMLLFWVGLFVLSPIWLGLLAALFVLFIGLFAGLSALIVGCVALMIVLVAAGAAVSLVGIVFGITQLFSFVAGGLYEIGLGVMIAGAVLFAAILIYNFSIRFLPWLITQVGTLLSFTCGKIKSLFLHLRRECYKL